MASDPRVIPSGEPMIRLEQFTSRVDEDTLHLILDGKQYVFPISMKVKPMHALFSADREPLVLDSATRVRIMRLVEAVTVAALTAPLDD